MPRAEADGQPSDRASARARSAAPSRGVPVRGSADTIFRFEARRTATVARWGLLLWWLAVLTGCASGPVTTDSRYVARFQLREGFVCVVAEGDLEPRSIGTFTVLVYRNLDVGDYVAGVIARRDGFVKSAYRVTHQGGPGDEIVVEVETAGSGRFTTSVRFIFDPSAGSLRPLVDR